MAQKKIGLGGAVAIGVGGMVGGGIFAVLGLAARLAGGGTPVAFAIGGVVALLTAYSYARLAATYPSSGGTVVFLDKAFGSGLATGAINILLWVGYVVTLSLYAYAFGSYASTFFASGAARHVATSAVLVSITALNLARADVIARAEDWIVGLKLVILTLFVVAGARGVEPERLAPATWAPPLELVAGGMIIFVAYEGFQLIANAAPDIRSPRTTLPRAFFLAVGSVIVLYVTVAAVAVGNLDVGEIAEARDYALAVAARPALGKAGFDLIAVAALLSTASAINATLYGAARLSYQIARAGQLPEELERKIWHRPIEGLLITAALTLLAANLFDLSRLSTIASGGFLVVFAAVNAANGRLARKTGSLAWVSWLGCAATLAALATLVWYTARRAPGDLLVLVAMLTFAVTLEAGYRKATGRRLALSPPGGSD